MKRAFLACSGTWESKRRVRRDALWHYGPVTSEESPIIRLIGVYDADGSLRGEISYLIQRTFAGRHCALCDITHGALRKRRSWDRCSAQFSVRHGVEVHLAHLDDAPRSVLDHPDFRAPSVFVERADGVVEPLASPADLESCGNSPEKLFSLLEKGLADHR